MTQPIKTESALKKIKRYVKSIEHHGVVPYQLVRIIKQNVNRFKQLAFGWTTSKTMTLNIDGATVRTEKRIQELIEHLWACDAKTFYSSTRRMPGYVSIEFVHEADTATFMEIIFLGTQQQDDHKIRALDPDPDFHDNQWYWEVTPRYDVYDGGRHEYTGTEIVNDVDFTYVVSFPKSDYRWVLNRMINFLEEHNYAMPETPLADELQEKIREGVITI